MGNCFKSDTIDERKPLLSSISRMSSINQGTLCGICEQPSTDLKPLKKNDIESIRLVKFCGKCRAALGYS